MKAPARARRAAADPPPDPTLCEQEPIHIPGAIQPHGAVLVARADGLRISHASANLEAMLGAAPGAVFGRPLAEVVGIPAWLALAGATTQHGDAQEIAGPHDTRLRLNAHLHAGHLCVDIEPHRRESWRNAPFAPVREVLDSFQAARSQTELCDLAVRCLRAITGYDRVMALRFRDDGSGDIVSEARLPRLPPYLGQRYPASDVPAQARALYLRQRFGAVPDAHYHPVPLLSDPALGALPPFDLTYSALRSVSPIHRQYMQNMKSRASLTIALVEGEALWGLLICHHRSPRIVGPDMRSLAVIIGRTVSLLLASLGAAETSARQVRHSAILHTLIDRLSSAVPLVESMAMMGTEILRLVDAEGALVRYGGKLITLGATPSPEDSLQALHTLYPGPGGDVLAINDLGLRYPSLVDCTEAGSGALLLPLDDAADSAILWFRPERPRVITWGGDPNGHASVDAATGKLLPRHSFEPYREVVYGNAVPWSELDLSLARAFRRVVEIEQARLRKQQELERSNADLEEFSYAVSHDLKAPLRAITHLAQWIAEDLGPDIKPSTREDLKLLSERVGRMQTLLDGLLNYSRIGHQQNAIGPVEVGAVVRDVLALLVPPPDFIVTTEGGAVMLRTERVALQVVLENLISNAIKHHDRGCGCITVAARRLPDGAEIRVTDDGPGIPPQFHERVFGIFQTLKSRDEIESSGIGLAIVKRKIEVHGGRIWVESAPPARGTSFVFTWKDSL
jgi:light-regulated signal transduction histidine kinase (bacteriophytochrome)